MYRNYIKRFIDFTASLIGFIILFPILLIVSVFLYFANAGKPFFVQSRPGKNGVIFKIIKFKTMNDKKDKFGNLLSDEIRLTTIGKLVRKTSLDEIPQLLNVIKGDMSLIGPRPLLPSYLDYYTPFQHRRHEVKPGITGWTQVNGRNSLSWDQKFELDVWYVDHISFALDVKIIIKTIQKIIKTNEISAEGHATMPRFDDLQRNKTNS
ncbi:sugar transferase [Flavobacterium phycosphaerae]|uniref:sugar transferase n=1 Tax=Flavobacterium phycosphaerae TaxID=2697515 RepID=UPI001389E49E|nr:sugar transferase [Flavobacterium phycosphaerae]